MDKFTKADIIDVLYEKTDLNRIQSRNVYDLFIDEIKAAILRSQVIELRGFGTFEVKLKKQHRRARNPKTGEGITVGEHGAVIFRAGRELKRAAWNITSVKPEQDSSSDSNFK